MPDKPMKKDQLIVSLFKLIQEIPYASAIDTKKLATCSTKNALLFNLYKSIDVPVQYWVCSFTYKQSKKFTPEMNALLEKPLLVYHTFLKIQVNNKWIIVDATNDTGLESIGAQVQEAWDGKSDTLLAIRPTEFWQTDNPEAWKQKEYGKDPAEERRRKKFLPMFFAWITEMRHTSTQKS